MTEIQPEFRDVIKQVTLTQLQKDFADMSVVEKATLLNSLLVKHNPKTYKLESKLDTNVREIACNSDYEHNYMALDPIIYKLYGLGYKSYQGKSPKIGKILCKKI